MTAAVVFAVVFAAALLAFNVALVVGLFVVYPRWHARAYEARFPVRVPGWGTKLERIPIDARVEDFALMNECLVEAAVTKGLKRKDAKRKCDNLRVRFLLFDPGVEEESGGRASQHIRDPWRRKYKDPETGELRDMYVAGWHSGDEVTLVYRPELTLDAIEYDHEATHELQELDDGDDHGHVNPRFWGRHEGLEALSSRMYRERREAMSA